MPPRRDRLAFAVLAGVLAACSARASGQGQQQLVLNPTFRADDEGPLPAHWSVWAPAWEPAGCTLRATREGLLIRAPGKPYAVGGVWQELKGVRPEQAYAIEASCRLHDVPTPYRSAILRVSWLRGESPLHVAGMLVRGPSVVEGKATFDDVLVAPEEADGARLSLEVRWPQGGSVLWEHVRVRPTSPPPPRKVKIGTVYLRPRNSTPEKNLDLFCQQIDAAGKLGLDVVCLSEAITMVGTSASAVDVAEWGDVHLPAHATHVGAELWFAHAPGEEPAEVNASLEVYDGSNTDTGSTSTFTLTEDTAEGLFAGLYTYRVLVEVALSNVTAPDEVRIRLKAFADEPTGGAARDLTPLSATCWRWTV